MRTWAILAWMYVVFTKCVLGCVTNRTEALHIWVILGSKALLKKSNFPFLTISKVWFSSLIYTNQVSSLLQLLKPFIFISLSGFTNGSTFFIHFLSLFFHSIELQTWIKNHKCWHSSRGEYIEHNFSTFKVETKKLKFKILKK